MSSRKGARVGGGGVYILRDTPAGEMLKVLRVQAGKTKDCAREMSSEANSHNCDTTGRLP